MNSFASASTPMDEHKPLLNSCEQSTSPALVESSETSIENKVDLNHASSVWTEVMIIAKSTVPMVLAYILQYSVNLVAMVVVGRMEASDIAATSLALMISGFTGVSLFEGLANALDTLCSQAFGAGRPDMVGVHVQRMIHLMMMATIPISIVWLLSPHWLSILVSNPVIAEKGCRVIRILILGNPGYLLMEAGRRFVTSQGLFHAPIFVMSLSLPTMIAFSWLFVSYFDWGLDGAILALSAARTCFPIYLVIYVLLVKPSSLQCWGGFVPFQTTGWKRMIQLAIPSAAILEAEIFVFAYLSVVATHLSTAESAAQSVLLTLVAVILHIPIAIGVVSATRIGNLVGAEVLDTARLTMRLAVVIALVVGALNAALLLTFQTALLRTFTKDRVVADFAHYALPTMAACLVPQHVVGIINGTLRGVGRQSRGAIISFTLLVLVGIPSGITLCFGPPHLGLAGLWLGVGLGYSLTAVTSGVYSLSLIDLRKVIELAQESRSYF